ncbi:MAG TPA: tetratricopeptide repeat protein [candidate division WOR-3 bacterium]|uniref:Tetratricopeptide repeat protein n=1 Tax=candidate division WOR-3 bacterium TaxID=2052148 RepID=A0A7V0Q656_UNCW3|nr:tetratricopeptide repeat protein [candidate division WOR-3 bacterium]
MKCPFCGKENPPYASYCLYCGHNLKEEYILHLTHGERRLVTVLFADVAGFTKISEQLDPEDVLSLINKLFEKLEMPIEKYDGTIDKYLGDGVMVIFGAPQAHENDPERAVRASMEMQEIAKEYFRNFPQKLGIKITINTGVVVAGYSGGKVKKSYTVIGDIVNVAKKMQDIADAGDVLVTETVKNFTSYLFDFEDIGLKFLAGREEPIHVYKLIGFRKGKEGELKAIKGKLIPLVGRSKELNILLNRKELAFSGKGQLVEITGEAGIGKSRMKLELKNSMAPGQANVYEGACINFGRIFLYWPFIEILRNIFEIIPDDHKEAIRWKLSKQAEKLNLEIPTVEVLANLLGIGSAEEIIEEKMVIFNSILTLFDKLSQKKPLVLIFEDIHWIDEASLELLRFLAEKISTKRILMLCLHRPEFNPAFPEMGHITIIFLTPLSFPESRQFVKYLLGVEDVPDSFVEIIVQKSEGNPLFMEEIISSLAGQRYISIENRKLKILKKIETTDIPASIHALITSELDKLPEDLREIVKIAAVIGREFNVRLLAMIARTENLEEKLRELENKGFIYKSKNKKDVYIFKHSFVRDGAYSLLLKSEKKQLHATVGFAIENIFKDRLEENYDILAYHFYEGEVTTKALEYLIKAARTHQKLHMYVMSYEKFKKALDVMNKMKIKERNRQSIEWQYLIYLGKGKAAEILGRWNEALADFQNAFSIAQDIKNIEYQMESGYYLAELLSLKGEYQNALKYIERLEGLSPRNSFYIDLKLLKSEILQLRGEYEKSIALLEESLTYPGVESDTFLKIKFYTKLAALYLEKGDFKLAHYYTKEAKKLAQSLEEPYTLNISLNLVAEQLNKLGVYEVAQDILSNAVKISREVGDKQTLQRIFYNLASTKEGLGEVSEALSLLRRALEISIQTEDRYFTGIILKKIGKIHVDYIKDRNQAIQNLKRSCEIFQSIGQKLNFYENYVLLSKIYADQSQLEDAYSIIKEASSWFKESKVEKNYLEATLTQAYIELLRGEFDEAYRKSIIKSKYKTGELSLLSCELKTLLFLLQKTPKISEELDTLAKEIEEIEKWPLSRACTIRLTIVKTLLNIMKEQYSEVISLYNKFTASLPITEFREERAFLNTLAGFARGMEGEKDQAIFMFEESLGLLDILGSIPLRIIARYFYLKFAIIKGLKEIYEKELPVIEQQIKDYNIRGLSLLTHLLQEERNKIAQQKKFE